MDNEDVKCALVSLDDQTIGCSGLLLSDSWVLTHGSLLSSVNSLENTLDDVRLEKDLVELHLRFRVQYQNVYKNAEIIELTSSQSFAWRCPRLRETFNQQLFSWSFGKVSNYNKSLLPIFVLSKLDDGQHRRYSVDNAKSVLRRLHSKVQESTGRGETLELESAPFARLDFLGSISRGLLSNVLGDCLLMSDVHAVPGCEGSPIFALKDGKRCLIGMVIASLSWCRGELVGYTFAASLRHCLETLLRPKDFNSTKTVLKYRDPLAESLDQSLVVVKCGAGWGTGVVLDHNTVLTCSHVVRESASRIVQIGAEEAELVYRTADDRPYDVAVLRLASGNGRQWKPIEFATQLPVKGLTVLAAGFPFFSDNAPASCSLGVVSRVSECVIQTSCCVQSGASGGPVIDVSTGRMIGLVVSNAKSAEPSSILYPRFNMAVPAMVLSRPIIDFMQTGDVSCLEKLSSDDPSVHETWNYNLTPRSKM